MTAQPGEVDEKDVLDSKDLEELYSWIDAVPLSRQKKNIARDFSDGVCVAEIVQYYMPRLVELHNYVNANSSGQKRINWSMLNRKIFVKLNLKLSDKLVENVVEAKPGAIEQVLWDLRKKMQELGPKSVATVQRSNTGTSQTTPKVVAGGYGEKKTASTSSGPVVISHQNPSKIPLKGQARSPSSGRKAHIGKGGEGTSYSSGFKDELSQYGNNMSANAASLKTESQPGTSTATTTGFFPGVIDVNNGNAIDPAALPPAHLIYKGHKMVPAVLLEVKNKQIRDLESIIGTLQKKVNFQDNLVQLKDTRVEDLTRQLHNLRSKFQELTQTNIPDL